MRRTLLLLALAACARGRSEEPVVDANPMVDGKLVDAPATPIDSPTGSGTCTMAFTGTLATWSFTGETGSQTQTVVGTKAAGITAGAITRSAGVTATAGTGSINSSNWGLVVTRDTTKYYAFTLSPAAGCTLSLTGAMVDGKSSGTGPVQAALATSVDNYAATTTVSTTAAGTVAFTAMANGMIEVRIYGFQASAIGGTFRLQNALSITGSLQ